MPIMNNNRIQFCELAEWEIVTARSSLTKDRNSYYSINLCHELPFVEHILLIDSQWKIGLQLGLPEIMK